MPLTISKATQRRFILHKQGLYPAHGWQGKEGVIQAVRADSVIQVDSLNVVREVLAEIEKRGPLSVRDFGGDKR